ncbi:MAG: hypothetical protein B6I28_05295 [Fusobacteriia bacterium 4572_132]|nr:MAG: hypothetical protein B6I28_05295 [Fusobacteriia bacterium 4572_132]
MTVAEIIIKKIKLFFKTTFDFLLRIEEKITYEMYKKEKYRRKKITKDIKSVSKKYANNKEKMQKMQNELNNLNSKLINQTKILDKKVRLNEELEEILESQKREIELLKEKISFFSNSYKSESEAKKEK